jgi:hypothetical protein
MSDAVPSLDRLTPEALALLLTEAAPAVRIRGVSRKPWSADALAGFEPYPAVSYDGAMQATGTLCDGQTLNRYYAQIERRGDWSGYAATARSAAEQAALDERTAIVATMLNAAWPFGVGPLRIGDTKLSQGITRANLPRAPAETYAVAPHVDIIPNHIAAVTHQFSCNLYLALPPAGGELAIWDIPAALVPLSLGEDGQISDARLPAPIRVRPEPGDVVILNSRKPHAVLGFSSGVRATHSCFLDIEPEAPIRMWV